MVNFYFKKNLITAFFIIFLLASIVNVGIAIITAINGTSVTPIVILLPVPVLGLLAYWRYLIAVYSNIPALIVDHYSIYIFEINRTLLWKDIESHKARKYIDGRIISIYLKLYDPKAFISSVNNAFIRFIYKLRYFCFRRIAIRVSMAFLRDDPESILEKIAEVTNT